MTHTPITTAAIKTNATAAKNRSLRSPVGLFTANSIGTDFLDGAETAFGREPGKAGWRIDECHEPRVDLVVAFLMITDDRLTVCALIFDSIRAVELQHIIERLFDL